MEVASSSLVSRSIKPIALAIGFLFAGMMELADMRDLGSRAERRAGSTPVTRTHKAECGIRKAEYKKLSLSAFRFLL